MKRKLISILSALVAGILITSTVFAGAIKFSGTTTFRLGSLIAEGALSGLGKQDVQVFLEASGNPVATCTNHGGTQAAGQNPSKVSASGDQLLFGFDLTRKNGKSPFDVETDEPLVLDAVLLGCPNANWTAAIDFVFWTDATIIVKSFPGGDVLLTRKYTCTTTLNSVTCTPVN
ncbi:MAG: hypothetical protein EHM21_06340 [Chloroflexi bacterium]|nr:MAG: hypothetical protein EHM21_06340 [Chloroflexota bacterium]